uniref:G protein signaling modulator 2, like n=1 Tax=Sander lucioperca TaxID=283035 RepID=A0A8D0AGG0_SANLU
MESSCLDLALEGERLCKAGDYRAEDLQILSAIYSQLGNAYFHLQEYNKALEYHRHDLTLTRTIGDELGEAKASGNLGNTLKLLGRYDEAVVCCQRHLEITRAMYDKVGQARALYNFGNVYHAKGKSICWTGAEPGEFPEEARIALRKAAQYYEANLCLVKELGDRAAQGRTHGNLGNTYYLLGDFDAAAAAHEKRLLIAKEFGDKSAERRAHCNLGNAHIFLSQFEVAAGHYKTLQLARLLKDKAVEAQACYSLGNTYTLLQDYERAIDYHLKHLVIAQDLNDRVGEGRAYWSLGNAHTALGNHQQAMYFAEKHLEIAKETGDKSGEMTATMNLADLRLVVGLKSNSNTHPNIFRNTNTNSSALPAGYQGYPKLRSRKRCGVSMLFTLSFLYLACRLSWSIYLKPFSNVIKSIFICFLTPMDDQRCSLLDDQRHLTVHSSPSSTPPLLASSQARRLDDQRVSLSHFPGLRLNTSNPLRTPSTSNTDQPDGDDVFFDILIKCQGSRLNDQRCAAPPSKTKGPTVPDEDFFSLIMRSQSNRMEEQRVLPPPGVTQSKPD